MNNFINITLRVLRWTAISVFVFFASIFVLAFTFDCSMDRLNNRVSVAFIQSVRSDMPIQLLNVDRVVGLNVADFDSVLATGEIYDYDVERDIHIFSEQPDSFMGCTLFQRLDLRERTNRSSFCSTRTGFSSASQTATLSQTTWGFTPQYRGASLTQQTVNLYIDNLTYDKKKSPRKGAFLFHQ
jgi:hypothetical protein